MTNKHAGKNLTHTLVKSVARPGRYGAGRGGLGLSLLVKRTANGKWSKSWSQRIRINGDLATFGLGSFPVVTLAMAKEKALDNARRVHQGEDIREPGPIVPTVAEAFEQVIALRSRAWKGSRTKENWYTSLRYCKPISSKLISEVNSAHVLKLLAPLWHDKHKTARDVRSNLCAVMQWAITAGLRTKNPADPSVTESLGKHPPSRRQKSLDHPLLGRALAMVRDADIWWAVKSCLLFIAFTGVRSGEARGATWDEIDLDKATWTIPATRMKAGIEHKVPLSHQAMQILAHARNQSNGSNGTIFPPQRGGQYIPSAGLSKLLTKLAIPAVPHGFRASFRNWAGGRPDIAQPAAEMVLAHTPTDAVVKAYMTADFFKLRQPIMQEWADYLTETMGPVIPTTRT